MNRTFQYWALACLAAGMGLYAPHLAAETEPVQSADEILDTESSVDDAEEYTGWTMGGDFRALYTFTDEDARDGTSFDNDNVIGRLRLATTWTITPMFRASARLAGSCTDDDCDLGFTLDREVSGTTLERGKFTFDELYLHFFRSDRLDIAVGRLQTKLATKAGMFSKSLDRADSDNANITWTDGLHATYKANNGWESHLILQHNSSSGAGNVRRGPLDFSSSDSRLTYVVAVENEQRWGPVVQRGLDVSFLPTSLLKDGTRAGRKKDYWGFVGRLAAEWGDGRRIRVAAEIGYAPETQTNAAGGFSGDGDVGGLAWNIAASLLDFRPGHGIGVNYGRIDPGWLLSPDFGDNEEQLELRYRWRTGSNLSVELRTRWREDLEQQESAVQKRDRFDYFLRVTKRFSIR